jgi:hypothetical protein
MIDQVLLAKRLFSIGASYSDAADPVSTGLAISLFQDSVELLVWCIAKNRSLQVNNKETFTSLLDKIEKDTHDALPHKAKLLELNQARVGFKHYGNLPATGESVKFRSYTLDFLTVACQRYLNVDFEKVSLASLIKSQKVREHVELAEARLAKGEASEAIREAAIARFLLFEDLGKQLPKVDQRICDADRLFGRHSGSRVFHYLAKYLAEITHFNVAALAGGSIGQHLYFERTLPRVVQFNAGNIEVSKPTRPTLELAERAIKYVTETAIRLAEVS